MNQRLRFGTLNANRLRDNIKRNDLFTFLKPYKLDIIALQETNFDDSLHPSWFTSMGCKALWTEKVAIIIFNHNITIEQEHILDNRIISVSLSYHSYKFRFTSVYAPSNSHDRYIFFENNLSQLSPNSLSIIAGDFNTFGQPHLDQSNGSTSYGWSALVPQLRRLNVNDLYRYHYPHEKGYTFRHHNSIESRLDYLFTSHQMLSTCDPPTITHCPYSDHHLVSSALILPQQLPHGPGSWRLDLTLLSDQIFIETVSAYLENTVTTNHTQPLHKLWEQSN